VATNLANHCGSLVRAVVLSCALKRLHSCLNTACPHIVGLSKGKESANKEDRCVDRSSCSKLTRNATGLTSPSLANGLP
jgi:hypothetical protein